MTENNYWNRWWLQRASRRRMLTGSGIALTGAASLALVGCGDDDGDDDDGTTTPGGTGSPSTEQPQRGGTLRTIGGPVGSLLDIHRTNTPFESAGVWHWAGNFLMRFAAQDPFLPEPDLAAAQPEITDDGTTLIFKIRPEAKWQQRAPANGRNVTADDVKATFERIKGLGAQSPRSGNYVNVDTITVIDPTTVQFKLKAPQADLLSAMSDQYDLIIPQEIAARGAEAIQTAEDVVGSGPYELVNFQAGQGFTMQRRADGYWKPDTAWVDGWEVVNQPDDQAKANALRAGQADSTDLPALLAQQFANDSNFHVTRAPNPTRECLLMNHKKAPYDNPQVRKALFMAIDRRQVYETVYGGGGIAGGPMTPAAPGWVLPEDELNTLPGFRDRPTEIKEAKALLSAAGFPNGFNDTVLTVTAFNVNLVNDIIVSNLRDIGVTLTTENIGTDFAVFLGREVRREYNLASTLFLSGPYPDAQLFIYHRSGAGGSRNYGDYSNPDLDAKLDRQRTIYDNEERRPLVHEIQRDLINDPGPGWIGSRIGFGVQAGKVQNVVATPFLAGYDDAENAWIKT
ncbi:MAG: ABC transporter substrate-binding protein [Dehalococcoidia bacterium]